MLLIRGEHGAGVLKAMMTQQAGNFRVWFVPVEAAEKRRFYLFLLFMFKVKRVRADPR